MPTPPPASRDDAEDAPLAPPVPGLRLAVAAEALFLANLLVAPGLAFAVLAVLWWHQRHSAPPLARQHLWQAVAVSFWGGTLLVALSALFILAGGLTWAWTWVVVILYFTCIHSTLVLFGMFGLARAMAGQPYRYPLIGPSLS
jgi:hypothetical protein